MVAQFDVQARSDDIYDPMQAKNRSLCGLAPVAVRDL